MKRAAIIARGQFGTNHAKTAHGLILQGRRYRIVGVIDETFAGRDAGEVMGIGTRGIPVVSGLDSLLSSSDRPEVLIIGVAPAGGRLPPSWKRDIRKAIRNGLGIVSGLHDLLGDDPELANLARKHRVRIWDVRRPPARLGLAGHWRSPVPVILTCGTDCNVGKRTVTTELVRAARKRGIRAACVATGQTGVMVGADAGCAIDHIPGDFMSGAVEGMVRKVVEKGAEMVFVQGQASLTHLAYAPVTLGILYGARPHFVVLVHDVSRKTRPAFPDQKVSEPAEEATLVGILSGAQPAALALNTRGARDPGAICRHYAAMTNLPTADVLRDGADRLLDGILRRLLGERKLKLGPGLKGAIGKLAGRR